MLFDSHCHLDFYDKAQLASIIERAEKHNLKFLHTIATDFLGHIRLIEICNAYNNVYCSVGVHPNNVKKEHELCCDQIIKLAQDKKVISIGETGLDYYCNKTEPGLQKQVFIQHIDAAKKLGLPIVVHSRQAEKDTAQILDKEIKNQEIPVVLHSFASSRELFDAALQNNWYVSFSGIVTFKNAKEIQKIATETPSEKILVETDAPYLAPVPMRGKQNLPEFVFYTVEFLKHLRKQDNLEQIMLKNFLDVFNRISVDRGSKNG